MTWLSPNSTSVYCLSINIVMIGEIMSLFTEFWDWNNTYRTEISEI